ncbi:MAG: hypothetical protein NT027_06990 [Proteobacteria bacterium]|nr:hypothetical protein [Pseudomonadota bacterium]
MNHIILMTDPNIDFTTAKVVYQSLGIHLTAITDISKLVSTVENRPTSAIIIIGLQMTHELFTACEKLRKTFHILELPIFIATPKKLDTIPHDLVKTGIDQLPVPSLDLTEASETVTKSIPKEMTLNEIRDMLSHAISPDSSLSKEPGLTSYANGNTDLFKVKFENDSVVIAKGRGFTLRQIKEADQPTIAKSSIFYRKINGQWMRVWPNTWLYRANQRAQQVVQKKEATSNAIKMIVGNIEAELFGKTKKS